MWKVVYIFERVRFCNFFRCHNSVFVSQSFIFYLNCRWKFRAFGVVMLHFEVKKTNPWKFRAFGVVMLHFEVKKTNPWGIFYLLIFFFKFFFKSPFLFFSDIPEFQVGGPVNQQIKNMWPNDKNLCVHHSNQKNYMAGLSENWYWRCINPF
jgi:hypothetical protein